MAENCLEWENKGDKLRAIRVGLGDDPLFVHSLSFYPSVLYIHIKPYALWWIDMFIDRINGHSVSYLIFDCMRVFFCFSPPQWNGKPNNELIIFFLDWLMIIFSFFLSFFLTTFVLFFFSCFAGIWATTSWLLLASAPSEDSTRCAICKSISPVDPSSPSSWFFYLPWNIFPLYMYRRDREGRRRKKNHYAYTTFFSFFFTGNPHVLTK